MKTEWDDYLRVLDLKSDRTNFKGRAPGLSPNEQRDLNSHVYYARWVFTNGLDFQCNLKEVGDLPSVKRSSDELVS
jgi:hypothetical protein